MGCKKKTMKRGEIYYLRGDRSYGHEMATGRPVVIVSSDESLRNSYTATVVFMTTAPKQWGTIVELNCTPRKSYVVCNQMATVDKERLADADKMCEVTAREMAEIEAGLLKVLGLNNDEPVCDNADIRRLEFEKDFYKRECDKWRDGMFSLLEKRLDEKKPVEPPVIEPEPVVPEVKEEPKPEMSDEEIVDILEQAGMKVSKKKEKPKKKEPVKADRKANINTDHWTTIVELTGLSKTTAQNIQAYRNKHGRYSCLEELMNVSRIGKICFDRYKDKLEV